MERRPGPEPEPIDPAGIAPDALPAGAWEDAGEADLPDPDEAPPRSERHLLRALLAVGLIVGLFAMPDLSAQPDRSGLTAYRGEIVEIDADRQPRPDQGFEPNVRVRMTEGPRAGEIVAAYLEGPGGSLDISTYRPGDDVVVTFSRAPDGSEYVAVSDRWRLPQLAGLAALFAIAVVLVGGWRGLRALIALGLTIAVVMRVLLPLLIEGVSPIPLAVAAATAVTIATIVLTEGWSRASVAAILGTATALALTGLLGAFVTQIGGFTGAAASDLIFLQTTSGGGLDLRGILLAAFILGSIGVLDDVTVTQAAFIDEVGERAGLRGRALFDSALDVGRSHIAATINTLFLAYVGATLPLLVVLIVSQQPAALVLNGETIAIEIVRTLVGSIGIVAAVPITSAIATALVGAADRDRTPPFDLDGDPFEPAPPPRRRLHLTDPLPALVGGLVVVALSTGLIAVILGPLGPAPAGSGAPSASPGATAGPSPGVGSPGPTIGAGASDQVDPTARPSASAPASTPAPSDDVVPLAVEGEPVDVGDADGRLGRVTLLVWEIDGTGAGATLHAQVAYEADRPWEIGPASWTLLAGTGEERAAVTGARTPGLVAQLLSPGAGVEGWIEVPLPSVDTDLFLVYRTPDGVAVFAIPLQ